MNVGGDRWEVRFNASVTVGGDRWEVYGVLRHLRGNEMRAVLVSN